MNEIIPIAPPTKSPEEMRSSILKLESAMLSDKSIQVHIEPKHYFAPGLYLREIFIPKGVVLTGRIHKTEHLCVLSLGKVSVYTEDGMKTLEASHVVHSMPGMKRVLYAHEDSVWINCHHNPSNEHDLDKIEEIYTTGTYEELTAFMQGKLTQGGN